MGAALLKEWSPQVLSLVLKLLAVADWKMEVTVQVDKALASLAGKWEPDYKDT
jgi:hypothetical protein